MANQMAGMHFAGWVPKLDENAVSATREIGIDAGHRVTNHGSKCRNLHGHRYTVQATVIGPPFEAGESEGMVLDFGFLKEEMVREIDAPCDHGLILWIDDPLVKSFLDLTHAIEVPEEQARFARGLGTSLEKLSDLVALRGYATACQRDGVGKLYLLDRVPTAENLARHWFLRLAPRVEGRTEKRAALARVRVWETPNCYADFPAR